MCLLGLIQQQNGFDDLPCSDSQEWQYVSVPDAGDIHNSSAHVDSHVDTV